MGISLTKQDVLGLVNNNDSRSKIAVAHKISAGYIRKEFSPEEKLIAEDIFRLLCRDIEVKVRLALSEAIKSSDELPHDIAVTLAKDIEEVATPIIEYSPVLQESDLIEILETGLPKKIAAVSKRKNISSAVSEKILKQSDDESIAKLFENESFANTEESFSKLIDEYASNPRILSGIINRVKIPTALTERLIISVSDNVVKGLKQKYDILPEKVSKIASHSNEIMTLSILNHNTDIFEIEHLVNHLDKFKRLTPSIIINGLCMGRRRFFVCALAKKAGISRQNAEVLASDVSLKGLHSLLKKAGISEKLHEAIALIYSLAEEKKKIDREISVRDFCTWLISKLEYFVEREKFEYLPYMITIAKQNQLART